MQPREISLIINTHEQPEYLRRVLQSVEKQSVLPKEVILADDGSTEATRALFAGWAGRQAFRCEHAWQEHSGFRRARILNQAISLATGTLVVFLDGDTVPHPRFLEDHLAVARVRCFVQGHRCLVERIAAEQFGTGSFATDRKRALLSCQLSGVLNAFRWPVNVSRLRKDLRGIRGCNLGIWRDDLIRVNGYNEAFEGWGREDSELAVRLMNHNVQRLDVRGRCVCYHLWHPPADRSKLPVNDHLLEDAIRTRSRRCDLGLDRHAA